MRKYSWIVTILCVFVLSSVAYADQYGAPEPTAQPGKVALTLGYTYYDSKWNSSDFKNDVKISQNRIFIQGSYSFVKDWEGYARFGMADFKSKDFWEDYSGWTDAGDMTDGFKPYGTIGIRGLLYNNGIFGIGPFAQGTYHFGEYKDTLFFDANNNATVKIENMWDITAGVAAQVKVANIITIYGGPFVYWTGARAKSEGMDAGNPFSDSYKPEEKNNVGGFLGVRVPITKGVSFNVEGQMKSQVSVGASLSYRF